MLHEDPRQGMDGDFRSPSRLSCVPHGSCAAGRFGRDLRRRGLVRVSAGLHALRVESDEMVHRRTLYSSAPLQADGTNRVRRGRLSRDALQATMDHMHATGGRA